MRYSVSMALSVSCGSFCHWFFWPFPEYIWYRDGRTTTAFYRVFPDGFSYLVTTGWIFEISLCENSIKRGLSKTHAQCAPLQVVNVYVKKTRTVRYLDSTNIEDYPHTHTHTASTGGGFEDVFDTSFCCWCVYSTPSQCVIIRLPPNFLTQNTTWNSILVRWTLDFKWTPRVILLSSIERKKMAGQKRIIDFLRHTHSNKLCRATSTFA